MYTILSKLAYLIIAPENWIIALLIWRFLSKSATTKRNLVITIVLLVFVGGNDVLFTRIVTAWQPQPVSFSNNASYEAGIVLGGITSFDKYGRGYLNGSADRFIEACVLYKTNKIKRIIISGGSNADNQPKDADFQYRKMIELGIPATDIIVEDSSRTTFENAAFTKLKIDSAHLKPPFVLITSAMHMPRAEKVFAKARIPVVPFPCAYAIIDSKFSFSDYIIPHLGTLLSWSSFLKEVIGVMGYQLFNKA